jgi:hypothetical protein
MRSRPKPFRPVNPSGAPATSPSPSLRDRYQSLGVERFYREHGASYRNPHEANVGAALGVAVKLLDISKEQRVLDLCCGSGEVTLALHALGFRELRGIDPYTADAYRERTGRQATQLDFDAIGQGALLGQRFDWIVCSFALHLLAPSKLPSVVWQLAQSAPNLLVLSPHKRPVLSAHWGFELRVEQVERRVRLRGYRRTVAAALALERA